MRVLRVIRAFLQKCKKPRVFRGHLQNARIFTTTSGPPSPHPQRGHFSKTRIFTTKLIRRPHQDKPPV